MISPPLNITWNGPLSENTPFAFVNRKIIDQLINSDDIRITFEKEVLKENPKILQLKNVCGSMVSPDVSVYHSGNPKFVIPQSGRWIMFQPWEMGSIYRDWLLYFKHRADEIWVYSKYNRNNYIMDGLPEEKIKTIPLGVDPDIFKPLARELNWTQSSKKQFKFLFVGTGIYRKGIDLLLNAYSKAFTKKDDVCLVIKDRENYSTNKNAVELIKSIQSNPDSPELIYINKFIPEENMPQLYNECDCLVHPYRAEGFGLTVAEAMACSLPVIITQGGSCDDFTNEQTVFYLKNVSKINIQMPNITIREAFVLEPSVEEIIEKMQYVYKNKNEAKSKGKTASEFIRTNFTWKKTGQVVSELLINNRGSQPIRHYLPVTVKEINLKEALIKAEDMIKNNDIANASNLYLELRNKFPESFEIATGLGLVAWYGSRYEEAQRWFAEALRLNPIDEDTLFNFCDVSLKLNQAQSAEFVLKKALSIKPTLSEVSRYLERLKQESIRGGGVRFEKFVAQREIVKKGEKLLREGMIEKSLEIFTEILKIDPEDFEAINDIGVIYYYLKDYEKAYKFFIQSLKIAPTVEDTLVNIFDVALRLHKVEEIIPVLKQAVQMRPELSDISSILAEIERKGADIYNIRNYENIDPMEEKFKKAEAHLEAGELNQATLCYLDVVDRKPYHDRAYNGLGIIAFYRGNYSDAYSLFRYAVELNPLNVDSIINWYDAAKKLNRELDVKPYLENIVQVDSSEKVKMALQEIV